MFDWEWRWFSAYVWKKNAWGLGIEIAGQKEYAFINVYVLRWELNLQWERDVDW